MSKNRLVGQAREAVGASPRIDDPETMAALRPIVRYEAARLARNTAYLEFDDLCQCGWIGALEALARYDPGRQVALGAFARSRIRGAMLDELRSARRSVGASLLDDAEQHPALILEPAWERLVQSCDVSNAIQRLAPADRTLVHLSFGNGYADARLASELGSTPSTVRRERWRILRVLREALDSPA